MISYFQLGRVIQLFMSESPYRELVIPWEPQYYGWGGLHGWQDEYAMDWDAVNMFPEFMKFWVFHPQFFQEMSSIHPVFYNFHIRIIFIRRQKPN